jgi:hypothetical protein
MEPYVPVHVFDDDGYIKIEHEVFKTPQAVKAFKKDHKNTSFDVFILIAF